MKRGKKTHFRFYIIVLFLFCLLLDDISDFIMGFYAGFRGSDMNYTQSTLAGGWVQRGIAVGIIVLLALFFDRQIKRRIATPVERLAEGLKEVSKGNLNVRVPMEGAFEFGQMEENFNYMVEELAQARRAKELQDERDKQLYTGIAHDLKTPMTMIMGYAKVLEEQKELPDEDRKRFLDTIIEQTKAANSLLDSMLSYAKLQNEKYELKREKKDLAECLRSCVAGCYPAFEQAGIESQLMIPEEEVLYYFDELEMKRVFTNLLTNLVKHNPEGISCVIQLEEIKAAEKEADRIRIVVADNGPKIAEGLQDSLFKPFAVGEASRNTKNGSGLGLSISKRIIERHGGMLAYVQEWKNGYKAFVIELE